MGWVFIGVIACALLGWYLYHRSKNNAAEDADQAKDVEGDDGYEDLLLTGLMLDEIYDEDEHDSSDDMDADDQALMDDGGYDNGSGFE